MDNAPDWDDAPDTSRGELYFLARGLRTLWFLVARERTRLLMAVLLLVCTELLGLAVPLVFKELVDYFPTVVLSGITPYVMVLILVMCSAQMAMLLMRRFLQEPVFAKAIIALENYWPVAAHRRLLALSLSYHERENTGKKIAKVNRGVERLVSMIGDLFWGGLPAALYLVLNGVIILFLDWRLGLMFVLPLIPAFWVHVRCIKKFRGTWEVYERKKEIAVGLFCQSIACVRTVQSTVGEKREDERHACERGAMEKMDVTASVSIQRSFLLMESIVEFSFAATIVLGLYFAYRGWCTLGVVTYITITGHATLQSVWSIVHVYTRAMRDLIAAERMYALLREDETVQNTAVGVIPPVSRGLISFRKVALQYQEKDEPVFKDLTLSVKRGEMLALVGRSGAGKSSIIGLLLRSYDPTSGSIAIDGTNVRSVDRDWYRRRFAYVPQEVEIFDGTLRENVAYAYPDAPEEIVLQALCAAGLEDAATSCGRFPSGLSTEVGERGVRLSGGERQRVGIARAYVALLSGATTLVLDEATSSLDSESEKIVQGFVRKLRREKKITIVAIAHRLSTIQEADRICVLDKGRIVEMGTHKKLLKKNGLYHRLVSLQRLGELRK